MSENTPEIQWLTPEPLQGVTFRDIEERAKDVAQQHDFDWTREGIFEFAHRLGGHLTVLSDPSPEESGGGSLFVYGFGKFEIRLSPTTGLLRDHFTVGHELGHYFLHSGENPGDKRIRAYRFNTGLEEQQANRFSAALLMPEEPFCKAAHSTNNNLVILSGYFNVSIQAVEARLKSLRIVKEK